MRILKKIKTDEQNVSEANTSRLQKAIIGEMKICGKPFHLCPNFCQRFCQDNTPSVIQSANFSSMGGGKSV